MPLIRSAIKGGFSVFPFLRRLRTLDDSTPERLVDLALQTPAIQALQNRSEFLELANLVAAHKPKNVLEIGTLAGGTLFVFARLATSNATVISLDLPASGFGRVVRQVQESVFRKFPRDQQRLIVIRQDSHLRDTRSKVAAALAGPIDFLFIDGDHTYQGVKADFEMYSSLVRPGGLVAFHDIAEHQNSDYGVTRFWIEVKSSYQHREIIQDPPEIEPMGIGVLWM